MALLPLHGKHGEGKFAIVDDDLFEELSKCRWLLSDKGYPYREMRPVEGFRGRRALHHVVLGITDPDMRRPVDHINQNKLDNRSENLRRTTPAVNLRNRPVYKNSSTGVRYVYLDKRRNPPKYGVVKNGKVLGTFETLEAAAEVASK